MFVCGVLLASAACRRSAPSGAADASARPDGAVNAAAPASVASEAAGGPDDAGLGDASGERGAPEAVADKEAERAVKGPPELPFGVAQISERAGCVALDGRVSKADIRTSFVDGDDLLALVNRSPTGKLSPDYAPSDLVDLATGAPRSPAECERMQCLRRDAAAALTELLARMKEEGFPGWVQSAFRSYRNQCGTFAIWANKNTFCRATEQSALPGHSQHQLGTTIDLFTEEWARAGAVFRPRFGCSPGGQWLREHAAEYGFVMSYPLHPDDVHPRQSCVPRWDIHVDINPRTGYRYEHWHFRYIGKDNAARFEAARAESGIGTPDELTLEQWLRRERGLTGAHAELPVCDACNCGACSTLAAPGEHPCDRRGGAVHLDARGAPVSTAEAPTIEGVEVAKARKGQGPFVDVAVDVPSGALTQPPIVGTGAASYTEGATSQALSPYPETRPRAFEPLPDAWVVGIEPVPNETGVAWPYRAALTTTVHGRIYNRANVLLPARAGRYRIKVPIPSGLGAAKVVLLRGGAPHGEAREIGLE